MTFRCVQQNIGAMKRLLRVCTALFLLLCVLSVSGAAQDREEYLSYAERIGVDPAGYLAEKALQKRLVLIGSRHRNPTIHHLMIRFLPDIVAKGGINTVFVEIPSDQQETIDHFLKGSAPVDEISISEVIASSTYHEVLLKVRELGLAIIAIDKPQGIPGSRDAWMARHIEDYFQTHPASRAMAVAGAMHVLKGIQWTCLGEPSLADLLDKDDIFTVIIMHDAIDVSHPMALDINPAAFKDVKDPSLKAIKTHSQVSLATAADGIIIVPLIR